MKTVHYVWKVNISDEPKAYLVSPVGTGIAPDGVLDIMFDDPEEAFDFLFHEGLVDQANAEGWLLVHITERIVMPIKKFIADKCDIVIDGGIMFDGPLDMFEENFISNATFANIHEWCRSFDPPKEFSWKYVQ